LACKDKPGMHRKPYLEGARLQHAIRPTATAGSPRSSDFMHSDTQQTLDAPALLELMWADGAGEISDANTSWFRYVTPAGVSTTVVGSGFAYDEERRPKRGLISGITASINHSKLLSIVDLKVETRDLLTAYRLGGRESLAFVLLNQARLEFGPAASIPAPAPPPHTAPRFANTPLSHGLCHASNQEA
jgi:hypothetical protein